MWGRNVTGGVVNVQGKVPFVEGCQLHGRYHGSNNDVISCKVTYQGPRAYLLC